MMSVLFHIAYISQAQAIIEHQTAVIFSIQYVAAVFSNLQMLFPKVT